MKFSDIQAKSIVDLTGGTLMGTVQNMLISVEDRLIKLIEVKLPGENEAASGYVPYFEISGLYSYALTLESASLMKAYQSIADLRCDLPDVTELIGKRVLSTRGNLLGQIVDFYYDDADYGIKLIYAAKKPNSERIVCYLEPGFNINESFVLIDENQCLLESSLSMGESAGEYAQKILQLLEESDRIYEAKAAELADRRGTGELYGNSQQSSQASAGEGYSSMATAGTAADNKAESKGEAGQDALSPPSFMENQYQPSSPTQDALPGGFRYANYQGRQEVFSNFTPSPQGDGYVDMAGRPYIASSKFPDQPYDTASAGYQPEELPIARAYAETDYRDDGFAAQTVPSANLGGDAPQDSIWHELGGLYDGLSGQLDPTVMGAVSTPSKHLSPDEQPVEAPDPNANNMTEDSSLFNEFAEIFGI